MWRQHVRRGDSATERGCERSVSVPRALSLPPRRRRRKRFLTIPAVGAIIAALFVLPNSAPQASEVLERAITAEGKPFDQTYAEEIVEFDTLPDTPANRRLLALQ